MKGQRTTLVTIPFLILGMTWLLAGCQKSGGSDSSLPQNSDPSGISNPFPYGQNPLPASPSSPGTTNTPGANGTDPVTTMLPGSRTPAAGIPTRNGGVPLSIPSDYDFPNLLGNVASRIAPFDPRQIKDASFLNVLYCAVAARLNRSGLSFVDSYDYVEALYLDVLGRLAEPSGLAYWVSRVPNVYSAADRAEVARGILTSEESYRRIVRAAYVTYLLRAPGENGSYFEGQWAVDLLKQGSRVEDVYAAFLGSYEYMAYRAHGDPQELVRMYYRQILGREVESQGALDYWVGQLNAQGGIGSDSARRFVAVHILDSDESRIKQIDMNYRRYLGRFAEPSGRQAWLSQMQSGAIHNLTLQLGIVSSDEYLNRQPARLRPFSLDSFCSAQR